MFLAEDKKEGFGKTFFALLFASKTVSNEFYTKVRGILYEYTPMWMSGISNLSEQDQDVFWKLVKGKLIYTDPETKKETKLYIKDLQNPLEGKLPLSVCDNAEKFLSINMGYRKEINLKHGKKLELWISPSFLVNKKNLHTISSDNSSKKEQVSMFWICGKYPTTKYEHLALENMEQLSEGHLFKIWEKVNPSNQSTYCVGHSAVSNYAYLILGGDCFLKLMNIKFHL